MGLLSFGLSALNGVAGAAASALSAEQNWKYKKKEMELQQQYAVENYQRQLADQERLLEEQRAYDSPAAVAERYRAGGISPLSAFGGSAVGQTGASSVPSIAAPSASGSYGQDIPVPDMLEAEKVGADVEKTEVEIEEGRVRVLGIELDNRLKLVNANIAETTESDQVEITKERLEQLKNENSNLILDLSVKLSQKDLNSAERDLILEQINTQVEQTAILSIKAKYQSELSKAEVDQLVANAQRAVADADYIRQLKLTEEVRTEVERIVLEIKEYERDIAYYERDIKHFERDVAAKDAKHMTDKYGRAMNRIGQLTGALGNLLAGSGAKLLSKK